MMLINSTLSSCTVDYGIIDEIEEESKEKQYFRFR